LGILNRLRGRQIGALHIQDPYILKVQAAEVDKVKKFSTMIVDNSVDRGVDQWHRAVLKVWMDGKDEAWAIAQGASRDIYPTDDILTTAFWRMLMGPTDGVSAPALDVDHCIANWVYFESQSKDFKTANMGKAESEVLKMISNAVGYDTYDGWPMWLKTLLRH
jgi:hypothetical protein